MRVCQFRPSLSLPKRNRLLLTHGRVCLFSRGKTVEDLKGLRGGRSMYNSYASRRYEYGSTAVRSVEKAGGILRWYWNENQVFPFLFLLSLFFPLFFSDPAARPPLVVAGFIHTRYEVCLCGATGCWRHRATILLRPSPLSTCVCIYPCLQPCM